jgi:hypothetical protein
MAEKSIFTVFRQRLQNLSAANRNLFLPRLLASQMVDVHEFGFLLRQHSFAVVESLIRRKPVRICAQVDSRHEATNVVSEKLSRLVRHAQYFTEEKGTHDLYLAWPFVSGMFRNQTPVRTPLLFFPVQLEVRDQHWWLVPLPDSAQLNATFLLAYAWHNQLPLNNTLLEWEYDEPQEDGVGFINSLYQLLQQAQLELNFNADTFRQQLEPFENFTKQAFAEKQHVGKLMLRPEAVLGIFPQSSSTLPPDYEALEQQYPEISVEDFLQQHFAQPIKQNTPRTEDTYTPFRLDGWQEQALLQVKTGQSLIVKGPPGTGKSQLIANLVCDAIANRKRVLVVSQKRVALEVVYQRLLEKRLNDFVGLVHDYQHDRPVIYAQVGRQIDRLDEYKQYNNSVDAIQLEREFVQTSRRLDAIKEELEDFRTELFRIQDCGLSAKELYLLAEPDKLVLPMESVVHFFSQSTLTEFLAALKRWEVLAQKLETPQHPWFNRPSLAAFSAADGPAYQATVRALETGAMNIPTESEKVLGRSLGWSELLAWQPFQENLKQLGNVAWQGHVYLYLQAMSVEVQDEISLLWLANEERVVLECFGAEGMEETTASEQLGALQLALERANRARTNVFRLMWWELFGTDRVLLKRTLIANGLPATKEGMLRLEKRIDNRLNFEHHHTKLKQRPWLQELPTDRQEARWRQWFSNQLQAIRAYHWWAEIRGLRNFIHPQHLEAGVFSDRVLWLFHQLKRQQEVQEQARARLSDFQVKQIISGSGYADLLLHALQSDGEELAELDRMQDAWRPEEKAVITRWSELQGTWAERVSALKNGWALAWLKQIELQRPILRLPSTGKLAVLETELQELIERHQALAADLVVLRAREKALDDWVMNRLNNRVTYRDLYHQVTKRRKLWPLRKTITEFESELFRLVPVWLASPEATSALFPLAQVFDLLIFDEASQCFPEQALPALYRGKQAVVAGDEQQLRPHQGYAIRWSDDEAEDEDQEVDSFLDLALRHFPHAVLQGHYRSRVPELIAFSNQHFYKNQLMMVPHANRESARAIQVVHVDGVWHQNTNRVEADTVVQLVQKLAQQHPEKSIGVITFNAPQQDLIEDLLQRAAVQIPGLIVKNIENVQGDERDLIIFSMGYAPNEKGKITAQFGSLNLAGGENRLNVAVTRAREQIWLVTSVTPDKLPVENVLNRGPKLLKAYLEFAWRQGSVEATEVAPTANLLGARLANELALQPVHLPFATLIKTGSGEPPMLVLTDDHYYQQHPSAKSWHGYVPRLLQEKEWRAIAVYSRQFCFDRKKVAMTLARDGAAGG